MAKNRQRTAAPPPECESDEFPPPENSSTPPVWSRRMWTGKAAIEVAVFTREVTSDNGSFTTYNVTAKRTYKKDDAYHTAAGFRSDDLPTLIQVLSQAYSFIAHQQNKPEAV